MSLNRHRGMYECLLRCNRLCAACCGPVLSSLVLCRCTQAHDLDIWSATDLDVGGLGAGGLTDGGDTPVISDVPIWLFDSHQTPHYQFLLDDLLVYSDWHSGLWHSAHARHLRHRYHYLMSENSTMPRLGYGSPLITWCRSASQCGQESRALHAVTSRVLCLRSKLIVLDSPLLCCPSQYRQECS